MANVLNTPEQVKAAAQEMIQHSEEQATERKNVVVKSIEELANLNPAFGGFDGIGLLLALPEDQFALLAPTFLHEVEKSINNSNDQFAMAQAMNTAGYRIEDLKTTFDTICSEIDAQMTTLTAQKRDFLKSLVGITYNAVSAADGITKRHILIPIEYCREDAKMPTYAHLTDAGMDIYALEDIDILPGETKLIPTGIKIAIPLGYAMLIHPRSGTSLKTKLRICNSIGLIDSGYRGEIGVIVENIDSPIKDLEYHFEDGGKVVVDSILHGSTIHIEKGERFAQMRLVEVPKAVFYEVENVSEIGEDRKSGFGGTGKF